MNYIVENRKKNLVSIIIPCYNAEKYLDKCMESLLNQTYRDIEILLIDDGSTDDSLRICQRYMETDSRVRVFTQTNMGQGEARNRGLQESVGEYIVFVDSDDWMETYAVQELYDSLKSNDADIAIADLYRTKMDDEEVGSVYEEYVEDNLLEKGKNKGYVFEISSFPVSKLYKASIFIKSGFSFPNHFFEDVAAIPVLFAYADRISHVNRPLYYYRNHAGSTVNHIYRLDDRVKCLYSLVDIFKSHNLFTEYYDEMKQYMIRRLRINMRMVRRVLHIYENEFDNKQQMFLTRYFSERADEKIFNVVSFGSYNLYTVSKILMNSDPGEILTEYYGFQSIISLMNKENTLLNSVDAKHPVEFRQKGIINDLSNKLFYKSIMEFKDVDYFLVDFLEERYDIGISGNNYFTISEALEETSVLSEIKYKRIAREDPDTEELWEKSCDKFIELLKKYMPAHKIILVRMKLSEYYGKEGKEFLYPDAVKIRRINAILDRYYDYFMEKCPGATDISGLSEEDFYFTHIEFRHGCYPWHLKPSAYMKITEKIKEKM